MDLRDSIKDDHLIFDNLVTLTLEHRTTQEIDFDTRQVNSGRLWEIIENCLVRQVAERNTGSVRQIFEKGKSITADNFNLMDTIIEVPIKEGRVIEIGDTLTQTMTDSITRKWEILGIDFATLATRYRLGCRVL